jgi:ABC-type dipeptide/oligopeptide/nickel transport system permease subunit
MLFLALISATSLLAPLLPLPSPVAMHVERGPQAPRMPWVMPFGPKFERQYWVLSPIDKELVSLRQKLFREWQTGPLLGTDAKGRDVLSRLVWGSRTSLTIALAAALTSLLLGVVYGVMPVCRCCRSTKSRICRWRRVSFSGAMCICLNSVYKNTSIKTFLDAGLTHPTP